MKQSDLKNFQWLEKTFWGLWLLAPFLITLAIFETWSNNYVDLNTVPEYSTAVLNFSSMGQVLVGIELFIAIDVYCGLVVLMHLLVRKFGKEQGLVHSTLDTIHLIAWVLLIYTIIEIPLFNLNCFLLYKIGDLPIYEPVWFIDIVSVAFSLMLLALRILLKEAVFLREDADLTI